MIVSLRSAIFFPEAPIDMISVIERWDEIKGTVAKRIKENAGSPVHNATLLAPIGRPGKIVAIGLNYADHIEEAKNAGVKIPTEQVWFCKQATSVNYSFGEYTSRSCRTSLTMRSSSSSSLAREGRRILAQRAPGSCLWVYGRQ